MKNKKFSSIDNIIKIAKKGGMYILVDDENRENEGDLVIPALNVSQKSINFMAKYGRGLICLSLTNKQAKKLNLSLMSPVNKSRNQTAFTVSIEARKGVTTGISAKDRSVTIKTAIKTNVKRNEIISPGHIFPIISKEGGVLVRAGHTEASVDISRLAKKNPSAAICEIMNDKGVMARGAELFAFAKKHKLKIGRIDDLIAYRLKIEKLIKFKKSEKILIKNQKYQIKIFENLLDGSENFALVKGDLKKFDEIVESLKTMPEEMQQGGADAHFSEEEFDAWFEDVRTAFFDSGGNVPEYEGMGAASCVYKAKSAVRAFRR